MIVARGALNATQVSELVRLGKPGKYGDGAGLFLRVRKAGHATWLKQYRKPAGSLSATGKAAMGTKVLGVFPGMSLHQARIERGRFDPATAVALPGAEATAMASQPPRKVKGEPGKTPGGKDKRTFGERPSLPWKRLPEFWRLVAADEGGRWDERSRAIRFMILTASRIGNVVRNPKNPQDGDWREIDLVGKVWTVPRSKMKRKDHDKPNPKPHKVPLSDEAIRLLGTPPEGMQGPLFPNTTRDDVASYIKKLARTAPEFRDPDNGNQFITPHGFRSTLTGWAGDDLQERYSFEAQDFALDHDADMGKVQKVYHRNKRLVQRVLLMRDYATFAVSGKLPEGWEP